MLFIRKLRQRGLRIEQGCDRSTTCHAKPLQNACDVALLMHGDGVGLTIILKVNVKKESQFAEVFHLEFANLLIMSTLLAKMMRS